MKLLKILFLFVCVTGFSQAKVGTINIDYVLSNMTEFKEVQKNLEEYGTTLDTDLNKKVDEYKKLLEAYKETESTLTIQQKQTKQQEIIALEEDINNFKQNGTQLISLKKDELLRPLYQKIGASLEKIAKEGAFTQVLETNETVVYFDRNLDLTLAVLKDLGVTIEEK